MNKEFTIEFNCQKVENPEIEKLAEKMIENYKDMEEFKSEISKEEMDDAIYTLNSLIPTYNQIKRRYELIMRKDKRREVIKRERNRQIKLMKRRKKIWNRQK